MIETQHRIIIGDSRNMSELENESVHLVITSPPYWQLKDYGTNNQIGFNDSYEEYINNLSLVWSECHRVLHEGCRLCINIGDQFARSVYYGRYKVIPIRTEITKFCESIGFDYMGAIIWQKTTTMNTTGGANIMGSFPYPRNGILKLDYEFILIFKKQGEAPKPIKSLKEMSKLTNEEWNTYFTGHWYFPGVKQENHLAMFPEELPKRLIKMFSFVGDMVMDPFLGSGTTSLAAMNMDRNSTGFEINNDFTEIIAHKLSINKNRLFNDKVIEVLKQKTFDENFKDQIEKLPYIFKDPHKFDKKVDVKKLNYGSKIDNSIVQREEYYTVKYITNPEILELNNGLKVRLIGIKQDFSKTDEAIDFLRSKTMNQKVFLKYDSVKYDDNNNLMAYLYLQNKTFINAHLIKSLLVDIDNSYDFKYKQKFIDIRNG